ncbi:MAG: DUF305 domain-containing protein [Phycisphaerales bacterium]|nr:DUF305 domain-containing protein [Phycisphaerales bacterium]
MNQEHRGHEERPSDASAAHPQKHAGQGPYLMTLVSLAGSFVVMYGLMYSMADRWDTVYLNLSNAYMAGLMAGSMLPIMLLTMRGMFKNRKANSAMWGASVVILAACWFALRAEAGVGDRQFLRAMIPHHSAAIQMCKQSDIMDPRVKALCEEIRQSQEREIAQMKALLSEKK